MQSVVILFSAIRQGCPLLLSAEQCWLAATGLSQTHHPYVGPIHERAQPFGHILQCLQMGVSRPRSAEFSTVFRQLQSRQNSSPGERLYPPSHSLAFFDFFIHYRPILLRQVISLQFCLDHLCRFFSWSSLRAPQHDLFRSSQATIVCFEYCSVHFPEVGLSSSCCFLNQASPFIPLRFCESLI